MSKKVIIFGATGKVGTYVLDYAIKFFAGKDYEVIASGRRQTNFFEQMNVPYYSVNLSNK